MADEETEAGESRLGGINDHVEPRQSIWQSTKHFFAPFTRAGRAVWIWTAGPDPPQIQRVHPILPAVQTAPIKLLAVLLPKRRHKIAVLVLYYFLWLLAFATLMHKSDFSSEITGYGTPALIGCLGTYWYVGVDQIKS
jgi:hypothetical protein